MSLPAVVGTSHSAFPGSGNRYSSLERMSSGDPTMGALISYGKRFIDRGLPILILGETGTGKEYLARALHCYSARRQRSLIPVNCASIPETLIESELFGYARGAFSGAAPGGLRGKVVQADKGTLFLDEIGDMPAAQQTRLLRVLSEREVTPLGATAATPVDVQLICATHQDLCALVESGAFREDLYYRIAVGTLRLPALRERSDRRAIIGAMIAEEWPDANPATAITADALEVLLRYEWPGNLRQLRGVLSYACAIASDRQIDVGDLPTESLRLRRKTADNMAHAADVVAEAIQTVGKAPLAGGNTATVAAGGTTAVAEAAPHQCDVGDTRRDPALNDERGQLLHALTTARWNVSAAARNLGICRASIYRKLKALDIPHLRDCGPDLMTAMGPPPATFPPSHR